MTDSSDNDMERRSSFRLDMEKELVDITWTDDKGQERSKKIEGGLWRGGNDSFLLEAKFCLCR